MINFGKRKKSFQHVFYLKSTNIKQCFSKCALQPMFGSQRPCLWSNTFDLAYGQILLNVFFVKNGNVGMSEANQKPYVTTSLGRGFPAGIEIGALKKLWRYCGGNLVLCLASWYQSTKLPYTVPCYYLNG